MAESTLEKAIGEMLIDMFQSTVDQPLPPLILQLMRQLQAKTETDGDEDGQAERPRAMKADLFLPEWKADDRFDR